MITLQMTDEAILEEVAKALTEAKERFVIEGDILKEGNSEYLANDPEARKIYLGEKFRLN